MGSTWEQRGGQTRQCRETSNTNMSQKHRTMQGCPRSSFPVPSVKRTSSFPAETQKHNRTIRTFQQPQRVRDVLYFAPVLPYHVPSRFPDLDGAGQESRQAKGGHRVSAIMRGFRSQRRSTARFLPFTVPYKRREGGGEPPPILIYSQHDNETVLSSFFEAGIRPRPTLTIERYER